MTVADPVRCPRFTVVIPARDEERYLGATLESLSRQDFPGGVEVVVVDNGSTDGTAGVAAAHGATVVAEPEPGVCAARAAGTRAARGEIVVSTDADTTHPTDWLSRIDAAFRDAGIGCVAVAGPCRYTDAPTWAALFTGVLFGWVALVARLTGRVTYVTATNTAFRRDAQPGYDTRLTQGGDELDLLRRLRRRGRVVFDPGLVVATSSRRLARGWLHALVVTVALGYVVAYAVNRVARRRVVGTAPSCRDLPPLHRPAVPRPHRRPQPRLVPLVALALMVVVLTAGGRAAGHSGDVAGTLHAVWSKLR